jgi:hypothetical protein
MKYWGSTYYGSLIIKYLINIMPIIIIKYAYWCMGTVNVNTKIKLLLQWFCFFLMQLNDCFHMLFVVCDYGF